MGPRLVSVSTPWVINGGTKAVAVLIRSPSAQQPSFSHLWLRVHQYPIEVQYDHV